MILPADRLSRRLPKRFPVGTKYVVEGRPGRHGELRMFQRYVVMPDGRRINVAAEPGCLPAAHAPIRRRNRGSRPAPAKNGTSRSEKKIAASGTDGRKRH